MLPRAGLGTSNHFVWIPMIPYGPKIGYVALNGVLDEHSLVSLGDHTREHFVYTPDRMESVGCATRSNAGQGATQPESKPAPYQRLRWWLETAR